MRTKKLDFEWEVRGRQCIAHGALTNSKRSESFVKGIYPTHLKRAFGCRVVDTAGNEYIDFIAGLGTNLLGYAQEEITQAISAQARLGCSLSLGTDLEVRLAEKVKEFFPFIDMLRFLKTGGEATTAAVLIARAHTRRRHIVSDGYHAWHPEFTSLTPPANGITPHPFIRSLKSFEEYEDINFAEMAAVIVEPVITDVSLEHIEFLKSLRKRCTESGTLLIFDEVITGFRFPNYSVAQQFDIIPDLICLGKAIGGGMPLSVVGGRREIMESDYFVSSTFAGETVSLAASLKFLELLQGGKFKLDYLCQKAKQFQDNFNKIRPDIIRLEGYGTRGVFAGSDLNKALFMQECAKAGILIGPSFFFTFPHIEITDQVLSTFSDILTRIEIGHVSLEGEMPRKPYAQKVRENNV